MTKETPYYLLDLQKLRKNLLGLQDAFKARWPQFALGYSFKTNNLPWIVSWMRAQGILAEVVSTPEYELAKYVGYTDSQIILNGPQKGYATLEHVAKARGIVNLDSFEEIGYLQAHADHFPDGIKVGLRINFDLEADCPGETIPGSEPGRFGFNIENGDFHKAIEMLRSLPWVSVMGIHAHHSTRTKSLAIFKSVTAHACECALLCDHLEYIDLGGCLFGDKPGAPSFDDYAETIVGVLHQHGIAPSVRLILEPGAALVASPFSYVCKVIGTKDIKGVRIVYTDGSAKHIAPQANTPKFAYTLKSSSVDIIQRQVVSGYTCIEMDRFLELQQQPALVRGDEVTIHNVGAYTMSLTPLFIEYFPSVIVKDDNQFFTVRERWTTTEFIQKNKLYL